MTTSKVYPLARPGREIASWESGTGRWHLSRYHPDASGSLRAWDTADDYLVRYAIDAGWLETRPRLAVCNDHFGALSVALAQLQPETINDSCSAREAIRQNLAANRVTGPIVLDSIRPVGELDRVLIKLPKSLSLLEAQLHQLRPHLSIGAEIVAGGMVRYLSHAMTALLHDIIGPVHASLAVRKARLLITRFDHRQIAPPNPYPHRLRLRQWPTELVVHAGVFSMTRADAASLLLFDKLPPVLSPKHILDLGCGYGLLGLLAGQRYPTARLWFADDSHVAIESSRRNAMALLPGRDVVFVEQNSLQPPLAQAMDLILCNPPFHLNHQLTTHIAQQMIHDAGQALTPGGWLYLVSNRHLDYRGVLKRCLGGFTAVAEDARYRVIAAQRNI